MTFSEWLNRTSMTSLRALVISVVTTLVVIYFSVLSGCLLLDKESARAKLSEDPGIRASAQTSETSHHSYGMQLATAILTLLGAALGINAASQFGDRYTAKEHVEAKERGRVAGTAAAAVAAKLVAETTNGNGGEHITKDRPATQVNVEHAQEVMVGDQPPGKPRERPTGDARVDDERGEV